MHGLMPGRIQGSGPLGLISQFAKTEAGKVWSDPIYHMNDVRVYLGRQRRLGVLIKRMSLRPFAAVSVCSLFFLTQIAT